MNVYEGSLVATGLRFAVVVARFNSLVTEQLLSGALDALRRHGADEAAVDVYRCPGTFELPALLKRVALSGRYDGVVALGAVIRGGTPHFEFVAAEATKGVAHVALEAGCAVAMGVLTCDTMEQALERAGVKAGNKGAEAAAAAIEQANAFKAVVARAGKRAD
jgi:6,7-dimethyl-8-ribityllumazine synthase